jgi:orotidine-5'-phosphate decarboxylase
MVSPIVVALDFPELGPAREMARDLAEYAAGFKVGLELLTGVGPAAVSEIAGLGRPVFADAKLHDIPNTVERAAARIGAAGARWVTVHAAGGAEMVRAAVAGMGGNGVLAVTVLTSVDQPGLAAIGVDRPLIDQVLTLTALAESAGAEGVVCSPGEARAIKSARTGLTLFTPGVRPEGSNPHDQKRVSTPAEAIAAGADYLVIGRPITAAPDPVAAAREIASSITRIP